MSPVTPLRPPARVLAVAGSDSGGGAGIQADLATIGAWGGYGMTAVTAVTAQNTQGVQAVHVLPADVVTAQLEAVGADIGVDAVTIGMLGSVPVMHAVADWLEAARPPRVVLDPVMVASSGDRLTDAAGEDAEAAWARLLSLADLVTPNVPELAALTGRTLDEEDDPARALAAAVAAARGLVAADGPVGRGGTVLVKGGHLPADAEGCLTDVLVGPQGETAVTAPRVGTRATHGTGCTLSSALAVLAAGGRSWEEALRAARPWLTRALRGADGLGVGDRSRPTWHGPLDRRVPTDDDGRRA